jgi:hypothetical protein
MLFAFAIFISYTSSLQNNNVINFVHYYYQQAFSTSQYILYLLYFKNSLVIRVISITSIILFLLLSSLKQFYLCSILNCFSLHYNIILIIIII